MDGGYTPPDDADRGRRDGMRRALARRRYPMPARKGSRWWWTMAILPAMAVSAGGGSRLPHDSIVAAVNEGPLPTGVTSQQLQPQQPGAVSSIPQNSVAQP